MRKIKPADFAPDSRAAAILREGVSASGLELPVGDEERLLRKAISELESRYQP